MGVIAVMAVLIVVVATNGFGVFNKAKSGINKIEEDNLLEAARVFLVDVENDFVSSWPSTCNNKNAFTVVCNGANCFKVSITDGKISKTACTDDCWCEVPVEYIEDSLYFPAVNDNDDDLLEKFITLNCLSVF